MSERALIAFYGGTFDPIHYGHLRPVIALARLVNLQRMILLPNNIPPHPAATDSVGAAAAGDGAASAGRTTRLALHP